MHALTHATRRTRYIADSGPTARATRRAPQMRSVNPHPFAVGWHKAQRANYYFDAAWQSAQTLRRLVHANLTDQPLGKVPSSELLSQSMQTMLDSLCPGLSDDADSLRCFRQLLQLHLSGLSADELRELSGLLKRQRFDCVVTDLVIDDAMLEEYGFTNGPPHCRQRTLMFTRDLHDALEVAAEAADPARLACDGGRLLTAVQARQARDALAAFTAGRGQSGITLTGMADMANRLAQAIGLAATTDRVVAASPLPSGSSVAWQGRQLIVDGRMLTALQETRDRAVHAEWTRDLLELLLVHKLFGTSATLASLTQEQRSLLLRSVEQVLSCTPVITDHTLPVRAAAVLRQAKDFGTIQVFPTTGTMLGHAWIAPSLSVVPDKSGTVTEIGKRYMRPGLRLAPALCTVSEWQIRWLSSQENEDRYPAAQTWYLPVPSHKHRLQQAAEQTRDEWRRKGLPYRFIGTEPGMPPTGCRVTVWHAVHSAMDDDARALFEHFRQGLPDPESPTEVALRIGQFMDWMAVLAGQAGHARPDL